MTRLMEQAIEKLRQLPPEQQDSFAQFLMYKLEEDRQWEETTARYADKLEVLVNEIKAQEERGELEELDPDRL